MIKFFRNIRKKLLQNGKIKSYSIYAIGEIFLVVIGILIALQINNWNEAKKYRVQEIAFFDDIRIELEKDDANLDFLLGFYTNRVENLDTLLTYLRNPKDNMGLEIFGMFVEPLYYSEQPISNATSFETAKSSGDLSNFNKKELLKDLSQYYADFKQLEGTCSSITRIIENQFEPIMSTIPKSYINSKTGNYTISKESTKKFYNKIATIKDFRILKIDYLTLLQIPEFESYIVGDIGRSFNVLGKIESRKKVIQIIKNQINEK